MTAAEICHYYSSSEDERISEPAATKKGGSRVEENFVAAIRCYGSTGGKRRQRCCNHKGGSIRQHPNYEKDGSS